MIIKSYAKKLSNFIDINDIEWSTLINLSNGIMGFPVLSIAYTFQQCGIVLGTITLIVCGLLTSFSCKILLDSAELKNTKTLEYLAYRTLGQSGKFFTEICIIFLLFGSMVAYQQTLGDSAPFIASKLCGIKITAGLRAFLMIIITSVVILPLSLSKKLDKLSRASAMVLAFYCFFVTYLFTWVLSTTKNGEWKNNVIFWQFSGLFQAIPIYSISFSCQTILFVFYSEIPDNSVEKLKRNLDLSLFFSFLIYFFSGIFGYLAFCNVNIHGNIITNLPPTFLSEILAFGFILMALIGFPFIVFPCRNSLNSLLFSEMSKDTNETENRISESNFFKITIGVIVLATITGIIIPNMEFVLSVNGSINGSLICYILPGLIYIKANGKFDKFKIMANILLWCGLGVLFICSVKNLYHGQLLQSFQKDTQEIDVKSNQVLDSMKFIDNSEKFAKDIENEKIILKEQKKLLDALKERIQEKKDDLNVENFEDDTKKNSNDNQKLIDTIDLKNKELQKIIDKNDVIKKT